MYTKLRNKIWGLFNHSRSLKRKQGTKKGNIMALILRFITKDFSIYWPGQAFILNTQVLDSLYITLLIGNIKQY